MRPEGKTVGQKGTTVFQGKRVALGRKRPSKKDRPAVNGGDIESRGGKQEKVRYSHRGSSSKGSSKAKENREDDAGSWIPLTDAGEKMR